MHPAWRCLTGVLFGTAIAGGAVTAQAQECALTMNASIDLITSSDGALLIPMHIANSERYLRLSFSNAFSYVLEDVATELKLKTQAIPNGLKIEFEKQLIKRGAIAPFQLDGITSGGYNFLIAPKIRGTDPRLAGILGLDVLSGYNAELDIAAHKLRLFSEKHCPGKLVYWANSGIGSTPIVRQPTGHMIVPMNLDGREIEASFDTNAATSYLSLSAARGMFGLEAASPGMTLTPLSAFEREVRPTRHFRYPFKALTANGVTIVNPDVYVEDDGDGPACNGKPRTKLFFSSTCYGGGRDFTLGLKELSALHIFFAFSEKTIYFTLASTPQPSAAP